MHTSRTCCGVKAKIKYFSWWYLWAVLAPEITYQDTDGRTNNQDLCKWYCMKSLGNDFVDQESVGDLKDRIIDLECTLSNVQPHLKILHLNLHYMTHTTVICKWKETKKLLKIWRLWVSRTRNTIKEINNSNKKITFAKIPMNVDLPTWP